MTRPIYEAIASNAIAETGNEAEGSSRLLKKAALTREFSVSLGASS
jgi:hypothetical protein